MLKFQITPEELEALAPEVRAFYDESGRLKVDGLEDTTGLKKKLDEVLGEKKTEAQRRRELEAELQAIKDKQAEETGNYKVLYEAEVKKRSDAEAKASEKDKLFAKKEIDLAVSDLTSLALDGSGGLLASYVRPRLQYGDEGVVILGADGQPTATTLDDFKKELMADLALAPILKGSSGQGGGAQGGQSGRGNKAFKDMTERERVEFYNRDPEGFKKAVEAAKGK
jgi:hypothetical protein